MVNGSSEMYRATPRPWAALVRSSFSLCFFSMADSVEESGCMLSKKPAILGVLPSSETSELSILMCRQAGLSTDRFQEPWISETVGPFAQLLPDVVSSTYTQPSLPPEILALTT